MKEQLGWFIQTIHALTVPKRRLLVPEGEEVDRETLFATGFRPQPRRWIIERSFSWMVRLSSALPRSRGFAAKQ
ncbi:MAG TPA: hypothetical protein VHZ51_12920 [Ktedonobacteraceae bacterium]|nr:hypothetical protein [Ktedonobacteraceae bacterium]